MVPLRGRVLKHGDNVDTDRIFPARPCTSYRAPEPVFRAMENVDPGYSRKVPPRDILAASRTFNCGSSRENATDRGTVYNVGLGREAKAQIYPPLLQEMLSPGRLAVFVKKRLEEPN